MIAAFAHPNEAKRPSRESPSSLCYRPTVADPRAAMHNRSKQKLGKTWTIPAPSTARQLLRPKLRGGSACEKRP